MGVHRPNWWCYPERCANGHEWGPELMIVSWDAVRVCPGAGWAGAWPRSAGGALPGAGLPVGLVSAAARAPRL